MTSIDAAKLLGISVRRVQQMITRGQLKAIKHGPIWWVELEDVEAVMSRPKVGRPRGKSK